MQYLISQLVDLARLDRGPLELEIRSCNVGSIVESVVALQEAHAKNLRIEISSSVADDVGSIPADCERIQQVLSNLLGNALKFTPPGGTISLAVRREAGTARFEIADSGPGIPPDQVEHLFERYWQGSTAPRKGLGLGLYICKQIVEAHGGSIGVDSSPRGSTFWIRIPSSTSQRS
jgi:signal transduction histidine kinase